MKELCVYQGKTGAIDEVKRILNTPWLGEEGYTKRRIPKTHELKNHIRYYEQNVREGLFWTTSSFEPNGDGRRLFLKSTHVEGEYVFVEDYYSAEAHVFVIHSKP